MIRFDDYVIDREAATIMIGPVTRYFRPTHKHGRRSPYSKFDNIFFESICHLILNGWTRKQELYDHLFGDSADGGPNAGSNIIDVHLCRWRPEMQKIGLQIVKDKRGGTIWYKVVSEAKHVRSN